MNVIQRQVGVARAKRGAPGAGKRGIGPLAEVHVVVLRRGRPGSAHAVIHTNADIIAAGLEVLAATDASWSTATRRNESERARMLSACEGPADPKERQPLIDCVADPRTQEEDSVRGHLTARAIRAGRKGIRCRSRSIGVCAVVILASDGVIIGLEAPHPLINLEVVA